MTKTPHNPETVHAPIAGYTHQIEVAGKPRRLVLSGQIGRRSSMAVLFVSALAAPEYHVEVDAWACR